MTSSWAVDSTSAAMTALRGRLRLRRRSVRVANDASPESIPSACSGPESKWDLGHEPVAFLLGRQMALDSKAPARDVPRFLRPDGLLG